MGQGTALLLVVVVAAVFLYALYLVVRAAVEAGVRRALRDDRPEEIGSTTPWRDRGGQSTGRDARLAV